MKRRSGTKSPPELTFFTDADTGPTGDSDLVSIFRDAGLRVECHDDHFPSRTPDYVWLHRCAQEGWIAISKDERIRYSWRAKLSIMRNGVKLLVMIGKRPHAELAKNFVNTLPRIERFIKEHDYPFVARVYMAAPEDQKRGRGGQVSMWLAHQDWEQEEKHHDEAKE